MAKKVEKSGKVEFSNIVWVIDNLDKKQLELHDKKPSSPEEVMHSITEMIEDSFKVSMRWDTYSKSFLVTAVCDDAAATNAGLAISARGDDIVDASSIMVFKYFVIANRDLRGFADKVPTGVRG